MSLLWGTVIAHIYSICGFKVCMCYFWHVSWRMTVYGKRQEHLTSKGKYNCDIWMTSRAAIENPSDIWRACTRCTQPCRTVRKREVSGDVGLVEIVCTLCLMWINKLLPITTTQHWLPCQGNFDGKGNTGRQFCLNSLMKVEAVFLWKCAKCKEWTLALYTIYTFLHFTCF